MKNLIVFLLTLLWLNSLFAEERNSVLKFELKNPKYTDPITKKMEYVSPGSDLKALCRSYGYKYNVAGSLKIDTEYKGPTFWFQQKLERKEDHPRIASLTCSNYKEVAYPSQERGYYVELIQAENVAGVEITPSHTYLKWSCNFRGIEGEARFVNEDDYHYSGLKKYLLDYQITKTLMGCRYEFPVLTTIYSEPIKIKASHDNTIMLRLIIPNNIDISFKKLNEI